MPRPLLTVTGAALATTLVLAGCTTGDDNEPSTSTAATARTAATKGTVFDASTTHTIAVDIDDDDFQAMISTYLSSGDKDWITGTVTIDGTEYKDVGLKLKGNSTLRGVSTSSTPESLPWRIRLDKYVDGQNVDGYADFVVRANTSETSLNEFVALDLLADAGLASEPAIATRFSVNGSDDQLTLVLQNLDDDWQEASFDDDGILYKAEADGDYSYRGTDAADYEEAFSVEAGDEDYTPLIDFLDFVNNSSDEDFAAKLDEHLDVKSFARYLAFEDLIDNFDDIDGPGNNSFLEYDTDAGTFTVVAWDHNLAFGTQNGGGMGGMGGGQRGDGQPPADGEAPSGAQGDRPEPPTGGDADQQGGEAGGQVGAGQGGGRQGGGPGGMSGNNQLVTRFKANDTFDALYEQALTDLRAELYDSGELAASVDTWSDVISSGASDLVDADTLTKEADAIKAYADDSSAATEGGDASE